MSTPAASPKTAEIRLAHSPDSDDAFMFYALATGKVRLPGVKFQHILSDIESLNQAAIGLNQTAQSIRKTSDDLNRQVGPAAEDLRKTTASARAALEQAQVTLAAVRTVLGPGSPLDYQLTDTLEQTSDAARSLRQLTDYLQRDPSSVIRGRYEGDSGR